MITPKNKRPKKSRVLFNSGGRNQKVSKSFDISEAIVSLADNENCSVLDIICFIATRFYYHKNKKLHFIFNDLAKNGENFSKTYKPQIPKDLITHIKYTLRLSDRDYKVLRNGLEPYVLMCGLKTLQKFTDTLVPKT